MISAERATADLRGTVCRSCGARKRAGTSFDSRCFRMLPRHMQLALYKRVGEGYEAAYDGALRCIELRRKPAKEIGAGRHEQHSGKFAQVKYRKV